ncbi:hypothetical protein SAMN05421676_105159 [Salinibacillus kushneri]|uniref:Permease n=1 Tax=Salinibacillus kushneri TaxID=237682 RepID=A0A1I0F1I9_9BACI|nr:hypothetical protein [Salinibacillus kushneri]SET51648.1 hypothetical protein SAMN05421676_105159 [Salinibacillus kushneri]
MNKKTGQIQFVVFGFLFLAFSVIASIASISAGVFPMGHDIVLFGVSVMAFCNAYLYPQFKENDERSKRIREKGMFISYFFILGYMIILMGLFQFNVITLSGYQSVSVLAALTMMTVFISFVVFSRRF